MSEKIQKLIKRAKQEWEATADSLPQLICLLDRQGRIMRANMTVEYWQLASVIEVKGWEIHDLLHPDCSDSPCYLTEFWRQAEQGLKQGQPVEYEIKDEILNEYLHFQLRPVLNHHQNPKEDRDSFAIVVIENVTERKQAEEILKLSQFSMNQAAEAIFWLGPTGDFLYVNDTACDFLGYTRPELLNLTIYDIDPYYPIEAWTPHWKATKERGPITVESYHHTKDGQRIPVEVTFNYLEFQDKAYICTFARDITWRRWSTEALRDSEARYRAVVEDQTEMICRYDPNKTVIFANKAYSDFLGQEAEEITGNNLMTFIPKAHQKAAEKSIASLDYKNPVCTLEYWVTMPNGERRYQHWTHRAIFDPLLEISEFQAMGRDMTEHKQVEEALRQSNTELQARNKELDAFAHTVAHDLKNPLHLVVSRSELLETLMKENGTKPNKAWLEHLQVISQTGRKMGNITDELLLLAEIHQAEIEPKLLNMGRFVQQAQERLAHMIEEYQADIILPRAWPAAAGYGPWIEEVWVNYLSNAIKYGGRPPRLELGATVQADGMVRFWIGDNGCGLSQETSAQSFLPFTRFDQIDVQGHGLGLSIVQRIIERLGGQVGVECKPTPDQGCIFFFTLPTTL